MKSRILGPLAGTLLLLAAASPALAAPARVHIRVEGQKKTLVSERTVRTQRASFTKDGNPAHTCSGTSGGGALQVATHGAWGAKYSDGLGYFVSTIRGETHPGSPDYWAFWVNHRAASAGACTTELRPGDDVLFFVDRCDYDTVKQACANKPFLPLGLRVRRKARRNHCLTAHIVVYSPSGKASPARGAAVYSGRRRIGRTDGRGRVRFHLRRAGRIVLVARKAGAVTSEPEAVRVSK